MLFRSYEVSLVAVPAQPAAGIVKSKRYGAPPEETGITWQDESLLEMEKSRFYDGGMQHEKETH